VRNDYAPWTIASEGFFVPSEKEEEENTMVRTMIKSLQNEIGNVVCISGWVHRVRVLKQVVFVVIRDRTGLVQCVMTPLEYETQPLHLESVVRLHGMCVSGNNKLNSFEITVEEIEILNESQPELPFMVNGDSLDVQLDTLLNHRVLSLRNRKEQAVFKIEGTLSEGFGSFLRRNDFLEIHTPKIVKEGAEGGANVFSLDYFGEKAYLAQSPQFYKQMMVISGAERVFEIGPVFRAEPHSTSRHLNEYVSMDLEMAFIEDESELMTLETDLLRSMIEKVSLKCSGELELLGVELPIVPNEIPRMKLSEAIDILKSLYGKDDLEGDLDPDGERLIAKHVYELTGSEFLFLTHYPQYKRPMYTMPSGDLETKGFDLLFRGLEITTGGLRIHKLNQLKESMVRKGLDPEAYESYLEAFKYGAPPHGGLAIGLERLTAQLLGYKNIRRTTLFPRDGQRLVP